MTVIALFFCTLALLTAAKAMPSRCFPSTSNPVIPIDLNEALILARCHAACVQKHANQTTAMRTALEQNNAWPYVAISDLKNVENSCDVLGKVMECRRGCVKRLATENLTRSGCRETCFRECQEQCGNGESCTGAYHETTCSLICKKPLCGSGCILAAQLSETTDTEATPSSPSLAFELVPVQPTVHPREGVLYSVSTTERPQGRRSHIISFVAWVETNGNSFYLPLMSLEDTLDLGYFACSTVNLSIAVVNQYGNSNFSPSTEINVYGETRFPSQVEQSSINYEWFEDMRPGYDGLAVVNISWDAPEGEEFIHEYSITFFSQSAKCGGRHRLLEFNGINEKATYFTWMPLNMYRWPVITCIYQAQLKVLPCENTSCIAPIIPIKIDTLTMKDIVYPKMNLTCHKYINTSDGDISLYAQWEVDNTPRMLETIKTYQIYVSLVDNKGNFQTRINVLLNREVAADNASNAYLVNNLRPKVDENYKIIFTVTPGVENNYYWRPIPDRQECLVNVYPEKPSRPSATVNTFSINESIVFLNLTLLPPKSPYGKIVSYKVILTRHPVPIGEDPFGMNLVKRTELQMRDGGRMGILSAENVDSPYQHIEDSTVCLFAQVRARNEFLWSEWSEPFVLERYPNIHLNCTVLQQEPEFDDNVFTYAAVITGGIIFLVAVPVILVLTNSLYRKHKMKRDMKQVFKSTGYDNPIFRRDATQRRSSRGSLWLPLEVPKADDWELPSCSLLLNEEELLGEGCFGTVHKGVVKGPILHSRTMKNTICMNVAVKFLKRSASGYERTDFLEEIETLKMVAEGSNPHVVGLIGCVTIQEPICLVTEFVKYGDLLTYLTTIRKMISMGMKPKETDLYNVVDPSDPAAIIVESADVENSNVSAFSPSVNLGDVEPINLISFAYQIASGMEYLSSLDVVHRDLACRNILVGEGKQLKISDFGMARTVVMDEVYIKSSKGRLPWKWMAIESIINREFTTASDVWAYGVLLWEIATLGGFPYPAIPNDELLDHLKKGNRLECPSNCSSKVYDIMLICWTDDSSKRPSFSFLKTTFAEMLQENNPYIQFDNINTENPYYQNVDIINNNDPKRSASQLSDTVSIELLPSSSSSSPPQETSSCELIKSGIVETTSLQTEEQQATIVPPNLYVETPTKKCEKQGVFDLEQPDIVAHHPIQLFLKPTTPETDV